MGRLQNKIALLTGASRGLGRAIAETFVAEGATVILSGIHEDEGRAAAQTLNAHYTPLDVSDEASWERVMTDILKRHGRLDILVNNAGVSGFETGPVKHDPEHAALDDWRAVHRVNLDGTFLGCKHAIRAMRKTGEGSIINMSSRSGMVGIPAAAAYASSKAAIRNHTKTVALYCAEQGLNIRCNSLHPAAIDTPIWDPLVGNGPDREARRAELIKDTPMRRFGKPQEVAALAVMLASDEAAYMTGAELTIDGGLLAGTSGYKAEG